MGFHSLTTASSTLKRDLVNQVIPLELRSLAPKELRTHFAKSLGLPDTNIRIHRGSTTYSAYVDGKPVPTHAERERFASFRKEKQQREELAQAKLNARAKKRNERKNKLAKKDSKIEGATAALQQGIRNESEASLPRWSCRLTPKRGYIRASWKKIKNFQAQDYALLYRACHSIKQRNLLIAAANVAEDLFAKSPSGHLLAVAIKNNRYLKSVLKLKDGDLLHAGILTCIDETYEPGYRTQQYQLGPFVPYLIRLQEYYDVPNKTLYHSQEEYNRSQEKWAKNKGYETRMIGGLLYACIGNRFYNTLTNSKLSRTQRSLKAMGFEIEAKDIIRVDIDLSLPTLMNQYVQEIYGGQLLRPTTGQLREGRWITANNYNVPLALAKKSHAASHGGSLVGIECSCWDGFDIDIETKLAISRSKEVQLNQRIFKENFDILAKAGAFEFIEDKEGKSKSQLYSLLYNLVESQRMIPLHKYLESQNILFVAKHDGVDIFSAVTEEQKKRIRQIIEVACTITSMDTELEDGQGELLVIRGREAQYDVPTLYSFSLSPDSIGCNRANAPPNHRLPATSPARISIYPSSFSSLC